MNADTYEVIDIIHVGQYAGLASISSDGKKAIISDGQSLQYIDLETKELTELNDGDAQMAGAIFNPDGSGAYAVSQRIVNNTYGTAIHHITGNTANEAPDFDYDAGDPDPDTGAVTYTLDGTDSDDDYITYSASSLTGTTSESSGSFTYTQADPNDVITFSASDGHGGVTVKTVTIAPNNVPTLEEDEQSTNTATGVVNGSVTVQDLDGDTLEYDVIQGTKGTVVMRQDGTWTYTPTDEARHAAAASDAETEDQLSDSFTITVDDGRGGILSIPVSVDIEPSNVAPTFDVDVSDPDLEGRITYTVINPADDEDDTVTYSFSDPSHGSVELDGTSYVYTPDGSYEDDDFTIFADDGHGGITSYTVTYVAPEPPEQPTYTDAPGAPLGGITLTPDKTRAFQFSYDDATNQTYLRSSTPRAVTPSEIPSNSRATGSCPTDHREWSLPRCNSPTTASTHSSVRTTKVKTRHM